MSILNLLKDIPLSAVLKEKIADLKSENSVLKSEKESLGINLSQAEEKIRALEKQIIEKSHSNILVFNQKTGTWVDEKTSIHYCPKCKGSNALSPLQNKNHDWKCHVCGTILHDPDRPYPTPSANRGGGWMDWMGR